MSNIETATAPQTKSFSGGFLLYRKVGSHLKRPGVRSQAREPRFRHPTFGAAEIEARRLLASHPESTFVILQEVARVKLKPVEPKQPVDSDPPHVFEAHSRWVQETERANG
jgi:hypothetical protein